MEDQPKDLVHRTKAARRAYLDALDTCEDLADVRLNPTRREFALSQRAFERLYSAAEKRKELLRRALSDLLDELGCIPEFDPIVSANVGPSATLQ